MGLNAIERVLRVAYQTIPGCWGDSVGASLVRCSFASKLQSCQCLFVGRVFWQPRRAQQSSTSRAMVVPSSRSRTCWATSCE